MSVTINCTFKTQGSSFSVRWYLGCDNGTPFDNSPCYQNRTSFQNLNRQLILSNVTESDSGTYCCHVELANGKTGNGTGTRLEVSPVQCDSVNKSSNSSILYSVIGFEACVIIILLAALIKIRSREQLQTRPYDIPNQLLQQRVPSLTDYSLSGHRGSVSERWARRSLCRDLQAKYVSACQGQKHRGEHNVCICQTWEIKSPKWHSITGEIYPCQMGIKDLKMEGDV
ncbi:programmed cell death 1 ligand 1-like [Pelobates cultripes]|uniref:Programmed cell death 1 ligand 1-like n=1 Tax=Pelobates cultripes TaxID=61616 RepID=A0AAD1SY34_PELCU|nr:programmed cell death 1 ligand 1-like [Pelobates cultripes]